MPLFLYRHEPWHPERLGQNATLPGVGFIRGADPYALKGEDLGAFLGFWGEVQQPLAQLSPRGELALRRFDLALERRWPEDRVVDFAVAIEAALRVDPQEKSHLISGRAAQLTAAGDEHETNIRDECQEVFRLRNRILHERLSSLRDAVSSPNEVDALLQRAAGVTRAVLRAALLKGLLGGSEVMAS